MIMTAFATAIPVFAESTYADDAEAVADGMTCRVGDETTGTYYDTYANALTAVYASAKSNPNETYTITFIDNCKIVNAVTSSMELKKSNTWTANIVVEGNGKTLTSNVTPFDFNWNDNVTVKNLNIELTNGRFVHYGRGTNLTFIDCDFSASNSLSDTSGYFRRRSGTNDANTLTIRSTKANDPCEIKINNTGASAVIFGQEDGKNTRFIINFDNVKIDTSTTAPNVRFMKACYDQTTSSSIVNINNSNITVGSTLFEDLRSGSFNFTGGTKVNSTLNNAFLFQASANLVSSINVYVDATSDVDTGVFASCGTGVTKVAQFNVVSENAEFFSEYTAPTLKDGASVRTTLSDNGMRFTAAIASDNQADEYGIIITPTTETLTESSFTHSALTAASVKYAQVASTDDGFKKDDDGEKITYNAVIQGMKDPTKEYSARAYAKYTPEDNVNVTMYSDYSAENNARSIVYVAYKAVNDTSATYDADTYNCKIADGKYSPYSATQYSVLEDKYAYRYDEATESYTAKKEANRWSDNTTENGISVREIIIDTGKGGEDIEIVHISDLHLAWQSSELSDVYTERDKYMTFGDNITNAKKALNTFSNADQIVITGDIYDFLTSENVKQSFNDIFDGRENIMACIGNHDVVKAMGEENTYTAEEWQNIVDGRIGEIETTEKDYWTEGGEGDIFYSKKVLGNKVMLIQLDNGTTGEFREAQVNLLSADPELARSEGYSVLLFYHVPIATGNPEYKDIACDDKGQLNTKNFYNSKADTIGSYSSGASKDVYDLIVTHGDVIKGCFSGHVHSGFYTEIDAVDADGMYTVIPQYVLNAMLYDGGYALRITVK